MPIVLLSMLLNSVIGSHAFISTPFQARFSNNQSALNNASFVESAIAEVVHTHAVVEVPFIPHVVQGFLPSGVTKIHSLVQTGLTARSWRSELALRGP